MTSPLKNATQGQSPIRYSLSYDSQNQEHSVQNSSKKNWQMVRPSSSTPQTITVREVKVLSEEKYNQVKRDAKYYCEKHKQLHELRLRKEEVTRKAEEAGRKAAEHGRKTVEYGKKAKEADRNMRRAHNEMMQAG